MRKVYEQVVFAVGESEYTWADVVLAGVLRGEWREVADRALAGASLFARAQEAAEFPLSDDDIENAANDFRYERDLVTAEETEAWLARWDLDADAWMEWIGADLLRRRTVDEPGATELSPEETEAAVHSEAVCSDTLGRFAYRLAARAAISVRLAEEEGQGEPNGSGSDERKIEPPGLDFLPFFMHPEAVRSRLSELSRLESAYSRLRRDVVTPEGVEARVRAHQTDWLRVDARVLQLASEDVAREALLSIRDDGTSLEEIARDTGGDFRAGVFYLESFEPAFRDYVVAARRGELLGPLTGSGGWSLIQVEDKILPSVADPEIAARAEASLLESIEAREIDNRVSWRWKK